MYIHKYMQYTVHTNITSYMELICIYMCVCERESLSFFPNYDKIQCKSSHYPSVIYFYNLNVNDKDDKQIFKFS